MELMTDGELRLATWLALGWRVGRGHCLRGLGLHHPLCNCPDNPEEECSCYSADPSPCGYVDSECDHPHHFECMGENGAAIEKESIVAFVELQAWIARVNRDRSTRNRVHIVIELYFDESCGLHVIGSDDGHCQVSVDGKSFAEAACHLLIRSSEAV